MYASVLVHVRIDLDTDVADCALFALCQHGLQFHWFHQNSIAFNREKRLIGCYKLSEACHKPVGYGMARMYVDEQGRVADTGRPLRHVSPQML